ncbi:hypothetical protein AYO48_03655 [Gaiella sp. SCGC AG-212-M14]|nr:hypothetical protein AYO48_03655 [Gaiella sp. SCGC AG-212-M14]
MPERSERAGAQSAILEQIEKLAKEGVDANWSAQAIRDLAEAYAWLVSPSQSHGGSAKLEK